jgi:hypothetical protein
MITTTVLEREKNDHFFGLFYALKRVFSQKTRLNAQKGRKIGVFRSHPEAMIVSETR